MQDKDNKEKNITNYNSINTILRKRNKTNQELKFIREVLLKNLKNYVSCNGIDQVLKESFISANCLHTLKVYKQYLNGNIYSWLLDIGVDENKVNELKNSRSKNRMRNLTSEKLSKDLSKDNCIECITKLSLEIGDTFTYRQLKKILSIKNVEKYWGTFNKMKEDLGLAINKECQISSELETKIGFENVSSKIADYFNNDKTLVFKVEYLNKNENFPSYGTMEKYCLKYFGVHFMQYLYIKYDMIVGDKGLGTHYAFKDGEIALSSYEYMFSNYLRNKFSLNYNKDYFRDVMYKDFINNYTDSKMNCDYVINIMGNNVYVEVAGIISDSNWETVRHKSLRSSKYQKKMIEKRDLLKYNKKNYLILFSSDFIDSKFKKKVDKIFEQIMKNVA